MRHDATVAGRAADDYRRQCEAAGIDVVSIRPELRVHVYADAASERDVLDVYGDISRRYPGVWIVQVISRRGETNTYRPRCECCGHTIGADDHGR